MNEDIDWPLVMAKSPPKKLYRYSPDNQWVESTILRRELYLASPATFNDPFDCQIKCHFSGKPANAKARIKDILLRSRERFRAPKHRFKVVSKVVAAANAGKLYCEMELENKLRRRLAEDGVICFCEDPLSILMWSLYSEKHTGLCLEFDTTVDSWIGESRKVQYLNAYPSLNFVDSDDWDKLFLSLILSKSKKWKHEKEWRFFDSDPPFNRKRCFPPRALTGIYFGARMAAERKAELARKYGNLPSGPTLWELSISDHKYTLVRNRYR